MKSDPSSYSPSYLLDPVPLPLNDGKVLMYLFPEQFSASKINWRSHINASSIICLLLAGNYCTDLFEIEPRVMQELPASLRLCLLNGIRQRNAIADESKLERPPTTMQAVGLIQESKVTLGGAYSTKFDFSDTPTSLTSRLKDLLSQPGKHAAVLIVNDQTFLFLFLNGYVLYIDTQSHSIKDKMFGVLAKYSSSSYVEFLVPVIKTFSRIKDTDFGRMKSIKYIL